MQSRGRDETRRAEQRERERESSAERSAEQRRKGAEQKRRRGQNWQSFVRKRKEKTLVGTLAGSASILYRERKSAWCAW